jgi:hypothetical protein
MREFCAFLAVTVKKYVFQNRHRVNILRPRSDLVLAMPLQASMWQKVTLFFVLKNQAPATN